MGCTLVVGTVAGRDFMKLPVLAGSHQDKFRGCGSLLEKKPARVGHCPKIQQGHCGMYGLNVGGQVWMGGIQGKGTEIPCRQTGTNRIFLKETPTF